MRALKWLGMVVMVAGLAACGGGGGGSSNEPVVSTESFNLINAWNNYATQNPMRQFTVTGTIRTIDGVAVPPREILGTGTFSETTFVTSPFELVKDALKKTTTRSVTVSVVGSGESINIPFAESYSYFQYNPNYYAPLGGEDSLGYRVALGSVNLPSSVKVGDKAKIYEENIYVSAFNSTPIGTQTIQYEIEADTSSTAKLNIIKTSKNMAGITTDVFTVTFRLSPNGDIQRLSETIATSGNELHFNYY
jgi:hypothetical protein